MHRSGLRTSRAAGRQVRPAVVGTVRRAGGGLLGAVGRSIAQAGVLDPPRPRGGHGADSVGPDLPHRRPTGAASRTDLLAAAAAGLRHTAATPPRRPPLAVPGALSAGHQQHPQRRRPRRLAGGGVRACRCADVAERSPAQDRRGPSRRGTPAAIHPHQPGVARRQRLRMCHRRHLGHAAEPADSRRRREHLWRGLADPHRHLDPVRPRQRRRQPDPHRGRRAGRSARHRFAQPLPAVRLLRRRRHRPLAGRNGPAGWTISTWGAPIDDARPRGSRPRRSASSGCGDARDWCSLPREPTS